IIGSGPGGCLAASRAGRRGLKAGRVARAKLLGAACWQRGRIPTKSFLCTSELYRHVRIAAATGTDVANPAINWAQAQKHKDKVVTKGANGIDYLMKKNKVTVVKGHGRLAGKGKVEVTGESGKQVLETKNVILATGSVPKSLPGVKVDHKQILNSDSVLEIEKIPSSIIVLGCGAVGAEFASIFNHMGAQTTAVEYFPHLLPLEDEDASKELQKHFRRRKIDFVLNANVEKAELGGKGVQVSMKVNNEPRVLEAEVVLSAVGRAPVTGDIGLETTNIKTERGGFIKTDEMMRTTEPNVYAI